SNAEVMEFNP
nr:Chain E, Peptide 1 [Pseudomonas aeruginosa]6P8S_F Chain F, Peptide 1 [Pseudomonas aeruginosa]6P8U_C Chain C, Peptide 1 [Pseudomonas aeruginosa]